MLHVKVGIVCHMSTDTEAPVRPWVPTDATFAARLAMVRHRMGWNLKDAALVCGIAPATWRLWELEGTQPRDLLAVCKPIAARAHCEYWWLVLGPRWKEELPHMDSNHEPTDGRLVATVGKLPRPGRPPVLPPTAYNRAGRPVGETRPLIPMMR